MELTKDLVAASATPLVLSILAEAESYGYAIIRHVRDLTADRLQWTDGMLYPVLHRLERQGWVDAAWRVSPEGRRRKYYRVTDAGRRQLAEQRRAWEMVDAALRRLWRDGAPEGNATDAAPPAGG